MLNNLTQEQLKLLAAAVIVAIILLIMIVLLVVLGKKRKKKKTVVKKRVVRQDGNEIPEKTLTPIENVPAFINEKTVQEFLPFNDITDSMICLDNGNYVMVLEVSSVNYYLRTAEEQATIESQFRDAISSWDFPFTLYTQTRKIDNSKILRILQEDHELYADRYPELREYSNNYIKSMKESEGSGITKKYYIIVSCNDAAFVNSLKTEEQRRDYAFEKLNLIVTKVWQGLSVMNVNVTVLNNQELVELLNSAINKSSTNLEGSIADFLQRSVDDGGKSLKLADSITVEMARQRFEDLLGKILNTGEMNQKREAQYYLDLIRNKQGSVLDSTNSDTFFEL